MSEREQTLHIQSHPRADCVNATPCGNEPLVRRRLLVIDDQDSITRVVSKIANQLGYETRTLNDPGQAFDVFEEYKPDVLVLDLVMPEVDGIDVLHKILAAGTTADIIVMSGFGKSYLRLGEEAAAFHAHRSVTTLAKPFRKAELAALLTRFQGQPLPAPTPQESHLSRGGIRMAG